MSDEVVNKCKKISYCSCIVVFSMLITLGLLIMLLNLSGLKIHMNGRTVEGTVVSYTLRKDTADSKYLCGYKCEYTDGINGKYYSTVTYYPVANKTNYKEYYESQIGKKIELVIDDSGHCIAKRDMAFDLIRWIFLPSGLLIIVGMSGIAVIAIKKFYFDKRKQAAIQTRIEEAELTELNDGFFIDGVFCSSMDSFVASLNCRNTLRQRQICAMPSDEATETVSRMDTESRKNFYWKGKVIPKNSRLYGELLERANSEQRKNQLI